MKKIIRRYLVITAVVTCLIGSTAYAYDSPFILGMTPRSASTVNGNLCTLDISCYSTLCGASVWNKSGSNRFMSVGAWAYDEDGTLINVSTNSGEKASGAGVSATIGTRNGDKTVGQGIIYNGTTSGSGVAETLSGSVTR